MIASVTLITLIFIFILMITLGGVYGGWEERDHAHFLKVLTLG